MGNFKIYVICHFTHCTTSQDHLEVDMLVEWMVQMIKWGLWKYGLQKGHTWNGDLQLPWLVVGYMFS
jgi:hypothetical protein